MKNQGTIHPLRRWRLKQGWSGYELADIAGISTAMVSMIETGERNPGPTTKIRIARALGVRVRDLFPPPEPPTDDEVAAEVEAIVQ
jgi:transcriptional regulator with XRE-family HTH domain